MSLDIDKLFQELLARCKVKDTYSVREVSASMKINYDYIELCASRDPKKNEILQWCRNLCECHAVEAGLRGKLPIRKAHEYWCENDDEYALEWGHEQFFEDER